MSIATQATFTLSRFEWTPPDRLDVAGAWSGSDLGELSDVTIVLHCRTSLHRLEAVRGVFNNSRNWSAGFAWRGDPASVDRAELVLGGSLVVELPASNTKQPRRRFGRTPLPVHELEQRGGQATVSADDVDVLALHAAMVGAQNDAAEARDELGRLQAETERLREQGKRERVRRESDGARLQESMETLRRLAESSLEKERDATRSVSTQLGELEESMTGLRADAAQLREQAEAVAAARDEATAQVRLQQEEIARLRSDHDRLARDARDVAERARADARAEVLQANAQLREAERAAATSAAQLEEELAGARRAQQESDAMRSQLAGARAELERANAEVERLRDKLAALREVVFS